MFTIITTGGATSTEHSWSGSVIPGAIGTDSDYVHPPTLANLDGDGDLEIVVGTSWRSGQADVATNVAVFQHTQSVADTCSAALPIEFHAPVGTQVGNSQIIVCDIDETTGLEIVSGSSYGGLYSWESDCDTRLGSPVLLHGDVDGTPVVADIDQNDGGKLEMIVKDLSGRVYVYDLKSDGPSEWGQFLHDPLHSSWYDAPYPRGTVSGGPAIRLSLGQNAPNPFNPWTMIGYEVGPGHPKRTTLAIYDVTGRLVRSLLDSWQEPGSYEAIWDGLDDDGGPVASGVYFYRLAAGEAVEVRRMLLLR